MYSSHMFCFVGVIMPDYKILGHFQVDRNHVLGQGTFGKVYKADDRRSNQSVAAKEIWMGKQHTQKERTQREAEVLMNIPSHPNIITYLGQKIESDHLWIFTELCDGGNLDDYCETLPYSEDERFDIMIQISNAISHVHKLDPPVVHRDIKPENILFTQIDGKPVMKLCDFGTAKIADVSRKFQTYAGTAEYMAPELSDVKEHYHLEDVEKTYGISVDVFSAGLLLEDFLDAVNRKMQPLRGKSHTILTAKATL